VLARRARATPRHVALAILALACGSKDAHVGCSPSLTCSLEEARFEPPPDRDAGPPACERDEGKVRCRARVVAAGGAHTCAVAPAGEILCWGDGRQGQLGDGRVHLPLAWDGGAPDGGAPGPGMFDAGLMPIAGDATDVTAGASHACAIDRGGRTFCWGRNAEGQVDEVASGKADVKEPIAVQVGTATDISAGGAHTCAVVRDGVVCWGSARYGQSGEVVGDFALAPGHVTGTDGAVEVAAGARHTCARFDDGHVACWGEVLDAAGKVQADPKPRTVPDLDDASAIAAGAGFSCALREDGAAVCWGLNDSGQLGDGTKRASAVPVTVTGLERSLRIAAGGGERDGTLVGHACAITKSFFVQCWGRNEEGQLGVGEAPDATRAAVVLGLPGEEDDEPFLPDVVDLDTGGFHTCAVDHDGPVICWGDDSFGQLDRNPKAEHAFGRPSETRIFSD
jgi:alpha-tubulin suppressor-like RCC1 family protein